MNSARYDAVVVGSGFGGALVARELVAAGLKTALLERGGWPRRDDADWDQRKILVENRPTLERISKVLAEKEVIEREELEKLVGGDDDQADPGS